MQESLLKVSFASIFTRTAVGFGLMMQLLSMYKFEQHTGKVVSSEWFGAPDDI